MKRIVLIVILLMLLVPRVARAAFPTTLPTPSPTAACTSPNTLISNDTGTGADSTLTAGIAGTTSPADAPFTSSGGVQGVCLTGHTGCSNNLPATYNLWNLIPELFGMPSNQGTGPCNINYNGTGTATITVNVTGLTSLNSGVIGYPNVQYGIPGGGDSAEGQAPQFPVKLSTLSSLTLEANYDLTISDSGANHDILLDEFLQPSATFGDSNGLEVAIFWYYNFAVPLTSVFVQQFVQPTLVNGTLENVAWQEFLSQPGGGSLGTVWFMPSPTSTISASTAYGAAVADVRSNVLPFFLEAWRVCGTECSSAESGVPWFVGPELGSEFGDSLNPHFTVTFQNPMLIQQCVTGAAAPSGPGSTGIMF